MNSAFIQRSTICALLMLGIAAAWYLFGIRNSVSFWYADDDYAYLSLAHALSFEQWLRGDSQIDNLALVGHPGIPFFLTSWIALKVALAASAHNSVQLLSGESGAVEGFWLVSRGIALLLTLGGVALIFRAAAGKFAIVTAAAATVLFLAASDQSWIAMSRLAIESFALAYALLYYLAAKNAFSEERRSATAWLIFGLVGGLGYTLKFHYIAFALGSAAGLTAMLAVGSCRLAEAHKLGIAYTIGFVLSFGALVMAILGERTWTLLGFHFSIATHSGSYGAGEANVVSLAQVKRAIEALASMPALIIVLLLVVVGAIQVMLTRWPDRDWRRSGFPLGVALLVALLLALSAVLKHFSQHYLVVPVSIVPPMLLYVAENGVSPLGSRVFVVFAGAVGLLSLPFTLVHFDLVQRTLFTTAARVKEDVAAIEARPLGANEIRIWEYALPARGFAVGFVVSYAVSSSISEWYQRADLSDRYHQILPRRPWRYAVLPKRYYPTAEDVSGWWAFKPGDRIESLKETFLVERPSIDKP